MPSSTSLLEGEETEPELPPLVVRAFADMGLDEHGPQSQAEPREPTGTPVPTSHFSLLGAVLDLQPLQCPQAAPPEEEEAAEESAPRDAAAGESDTLLAQAPGPGLASVLLPAMVESPETVMLYSGGLDDSTPRQVPGMLVIPPGYTEPGYPEPGYTEPGFEAEQPALLRRKSVNTTECVAVPSSEHVAEIVGRQGCKIKALRAKTNTYIKTPVRGEQPVFVVTGRKEDVAMAKREILSAAEHFSLIRASRNKPGPLGGPGLGCGPVLPGQTTIQVRVPYRVVGLVVGPKGATIKRIQQQTHTYIVTPSRDKEPVFEVTGMPENVDRAREEIEAHIAMRTGGCVEPAADDDDFHCNGTDVSFDASGCGEPLHSDMAAVTGGRSAGRMTCTYRNNSSSSLGSGGSNDSFYSGAGGRMADFSPTSPFNSNSAGSFWFGENLLQLGPDDLEVSAFEALTMSAPPLTGPQHPVLWSPFEQGLPLLEGRCQAPYRDSQPGTPRLSPTSHDSLEQPVGRHTRSDPVSTRLPRFPAYGVAFSSSSSGDSTTSSSPPDSAGPGGAYRGRQDCVRCLESECVAALVPCGHNLFCMECANRICQAEDATCPVCQAPVTQALRLRNM
ncbi:RNA-binding E3 ubiquitin-protein ligase MEX3C-like [Scleropages formosus]|uniref:RNA-binding E3 ubiquitin-protein ligase MEX3C-like n=1 Tax=Scleropages formosus TaxID=113540 RepID=A0A0N8K0B4_SCLFO|nr:RNA-binding E3 ubiquitin-protein ligase MEX3C-like [Scleropages formosus]